MTKHKIEKEALEITINIFDTVPLSLYERLERHYQRCKESRGELLEKYNALKAGREIEEHTDGG